MIYAGIGSRSTPPDVLKMFEDIAEILARGGHILRSGHAGGADLAFERGCDRAMGKKEIYLPWKGFNDSDSQLIVQPGEAFTIAESYHPAWSVLSQGAKKLQARNTHQILGWGLNSPVDIVVCWTPKGALKGGTAQALRLAAKYNIPVINFGSSSQHDSLKQQLLDFVK